LEIVRYLSPATISTLSKLNYSFYQLVRPYRNIMIIFNKDAHPVRTARSVTQSSHALSNVDVLQWSSQSSEDQPLQSSSALLSAYPLSVRVVLSNAPALTHLHTIILSSITLSSSHQASLAEFPSLCRLILRRATFDVNSGQNPGKRLRLRHLLISDISTDGTRALETGISSLLASTAETLESLSLREVSAEITRLHMRYSYPKLLVYRFISHTTKTEILSTALAHFLDRTPTIQQLDLRWVEPLCLEPNALPNLRHCSASYKNIPTLVRGRPVTSVSMVHLDCLYSTAEVHNLFKGIRKCSSPITHLDIHVIWHPQQFTGVRLAGTALSQLVQATLWITFAKIGRHDPCPHDGASPTPRTLTELRQAVACYAPPCPCYTEHRQLLFEVSLPSLRYLRILTCSQPSNGQDRRIPLELGARYFRNIIIPLNSPTEGMPQLVQVEFMQFAYDRIKFTVDEDRVLRYWKDVHGHGGWEVTVCETEEGLKAGNRNMRPK
jgi:hypothetical protein